MKRTKNKNPWLQEAGVDVGDLYLTTANQYRAVLAMKGDFLIYAPSSEGMEYLPSDGNISFENSPSKKCQNATFAQKEYQTFSWRGDRAVKHKLSALQLAQAINQSNAKAQIAVFMAE